MYISQKGKTIQKNGKKWQKWLKIANNLKISQVTKYCEKMARNYINKLIQWAETAKNGFKCFKMH